MVVLALLGEPPDPALPGGLRAAVAELAVAWAVRTAGPGLALVSDRVARAPAGARPFVEPDDHARVPAALTEALGGHTGPVVLVGPDVPRLDDELAAAALADLEAACALSFAPSTDGRPFLLALREPSPAALALLGGRDRESIFADALALGGEIGMLRSERRVVTLADARALAIDPLVPAELRELAAASGGVS